MTDEKEQTTILDEQPQVADGPLKQHLINYVGQKLKPENDAVTLDMLVGVLAEEFPEVVMALAEENFIRGYQQAVQDIEFMKEGGLQKAEVDNTIDAEVVKTENEQS
jgi:hypothetical protein